MYTPFMKITPATPPSRSANPTSLNDANKLSLHKLHRALEKWMIDTVGMYSVEVLVRGDRSHFACGTGHLRVEASLGSHMLHDARLKVACC